MLELTRTVVSLGGRAGSEPASEYIRSFGQFIVNGTFALNGYRFKNDTLRGLFLGFYWYSPVVDGTPSFSREDKERIEKITALKKQLGL